ncbi:MAG TPA: EAL domain-containing protein, partial [Tepidisphaeraceae bacterium]|nr:EAL domain-containing protein [Tepidisphaeraceae bacterium]
ALCLEITGHTVVGQTSLSAIQHLRSLGVRIFLDDFGAGRAALASLTRLPLDGIKLDSHLMNGADDHRRRAAVVRSMVHLAREMSVELVAKGIESPSQLQFLRAIGCPRAQGYAIAHPMNPGEIGRYLSIQRDQGGVRQAA